MFNLPWSIVIFGYDGNTLIFSQLSLLWIKESFLKFFFKYFVSELESSSVKNSNKKSHILFQGNPDLHRTYDNLSNPPSTNTPNNTNNNNNKNNTSRFSAYSTEVKIYYIFSLYM